MLFQNVSIIDILTVCLSALAFVLAWRKSGSEIDKNKSEVDKNKSDSSESDGQAAESFASAARIYSEENVKLHSKLQALETQLCQIQVDMDNQRKEHQLEIARLTQRLDVQAQEIIDLKDWATRLSAQVVSMGGEPVPYKLKGK